MNARFRRTTKPALLLAAIVFLLPLEVSKTLFPIQQLELSRLLMLVAIGWEAYRVARGVRPVPVLIAVAVAVNLAVIVASYAATRWDEGLVPTAAVVAYSAFSMFVADAVRSLHTVRIIAVALVASAAYVTFIIGLQIVTGLYLWRAPELQAAMRPNATFGDPNILARFVVLAIVVGIGLWASRGRRWVRWQWVLLSCLVVLTVALVQTQSRGGWVAFGVGVGLVAFVLRRTPGVLRAVAVVSLSFALATVANPAVLGRVSAVVGEATSRPMAPDGGPRAAPSPPGGELVRALPLDEVRTYLLEAGLAMWADHPLTGVGTGGFAPMMRGPYSDFIPEHRRTSPTLLPHTSLGQITAENGWAGLGAFAFGAWAVAAASLRALRGAASAWRAVMAVTLISMVVIVVASQLEGRLFPEPYLWLALGVLAAAVRISAERHGRAVRHHGSTA